MRLRPSTPLTVLLVVAFVLLLLAVISTPIIKAIPLGEYDGYTFGAFGYCPPDGSCTAIGIGYDLNGTPPTQDGAFTMSRAIRGTLSSVLILHPVAAGLVLIMLVLAASSHFHAPAHSSRFLLGLFIFTIITFIVCLATFVVDILLFIPHQAWGTYIVLASTILVLVSGVVTCAMRRSLISRKNRRRMIAENAEMNGENFYNREANNKPTSFMTPAAIPLSSGANTTNPGGNDNLPAFATFEDQKKDDQVSDERIPLTQRTSAGGPPGSQTSQPGESVAMGAVGAPPAVDRYGNPINPQDGYGVTRGPSMESMRSRGSYGGYRGRGRGGYDMYGAPRGRGGYGPPGRGGYPARGRGGYGPPPRGYGPGPMRGGRSPPPQAGYAGYYDSRQSPIDAYGSQGRRTSDGYSTNPSTNPSMPNVAGGYDAYNQRDSDYPRAESPPPTVVGEARGDGAIEMDATPAQADHGYAPYNGQLRDNDSDVAGMVGLQQGRVPERQNTYMSDGSKYSTDDQYFPARAAWSNGEGRGSPLNTQNQPMGGGLTAPPAVPRSDSGNYYEDVDPRFAGPSPGEAQPPAGNPSYEDVHATTSSSRARSPAESDRSNFTSISQRGVNPYWNPGSAPPMPYNQGAPPRRPVQQRQDMLLDNPDFQVPGGRSGAGSRGANRTTPGTVPGSAYPTGL